MQITFGARIIVFDPMIVRHRLIYQLIASSLADLHKRKGSLVFIIECAVLSLGNPIIMASRGRVTESPCLSPRIDHRGTATTNYETVIAGTW